MMKEESHEIAAQRTEKKYTYFELLVSLQNLSAQCKVMHRALVIVVNDITFPILSLVRGLCPSLALSFTRGWGAWRLC